MAEYRRQLQQAWRWLLAHRWLALAFILLGVGLQVFAEIAEDFASSEFAHFDHMILHAFRGIHSPLLNTLAIIFSWPLIWPNVLILILPCLIYLLLTRRYRVAIGYLCIIIMTAVLVDSLKAFFARPRPTGARIIVQGFSFPSGHAMSGMVIYGLIGYLACRFLIRRRWPRLLLCAILAIFIILTGLSRVYLGVHYPSDILAGWSAGTSVLFGCIILLEGLQYRRPSDNKSR